MREAIAAYLAEHPEDMLPELSPEEECRVALGYAGRMARLVARCELGYFIAAVRYGREHREELRRNRHRWSVLATNFAESLQEAADDLRELGLHDEAIGLAEALGTRIGRERKAYLEREGLDPEIGKQVPLAVDALRRFEQLDPLRN